jgi:hypothetical protein
MRLCAMHAKLRTVPQRASPRTWKRPRPCCFSWPFTGSTVSRSNRNGFARPGDARLTGDNYF